MENMNIYGKIHNSVINEARILFIRSNIH